jgi:hypothetical protein
VADYYDKRRKERSKRVPESPGETFDNLHLVVAGERLVQALPEAGKAGEVMPVPTLNQGTIQGRPLDVGARVGIMRNLEFSAGGRVHRISKGSYSKA